MTTEGKSEAVERARDFVAVTPRAKASPIIRKLLEALAQRDELIEALEAICRETGDRGDGLIDWQRCVDRIQKIASAALNKDKAL